MEPIITYTHKMSQDENENNDDEFFDENICKEKFNTFVSEHPELQKVECIGIRTYYTDRVPRKKKCSDKLTMIFNNHKGFPPYVMDEELYYLIDNKIDCTGVVMFKETNVLEVPYLIKKLDETNYCAMCTITNMYEAKFYDMGNKKLILICEVDTESG